MPPHKGHELAIQTGIDMCNKMHVLVSGRKDDNPDRYQRMNWLHRTFKNAHIIGEIDTILEPSYDSNGTAIGGWFWDQWILKIKTLFGKIDAVFTNDAYGERLAYELGAEWIPIDSDRTLYDISATKIRNNPRRYWDYINEEAKGFYQKRIAIVGPESTGKTSLVNYLGQVFSDAQVIPEYGRTISELKNNQLTERDFRVIVRGQQTLLQAADASIVISDTEVYTTQLFANIYLKEYTESLRNDIFLAALTEHYDLYLLLAPTVPWVDDDERILSPEQREQFFQDLKQYLDSYNKNYKIIDSTSFDTRRIEARYAIYNLIKEPI